MDYNKEIINVRTTRLTNIILGINDLTDKLPKLATDILNREGLLDSLFLLYEECKKDGLCRKDKYIAEFATKYRGLIKETRSLRVNINDFQIKELIGKGHFGEVHLVEEKQTNDIYAMKKIPKCQINSSHFKEERDIMACYNSEWITSLQYAFQDNVNLYLVMEYLPGGDLLTLMERYGALEEDDIRFYLSEIAFALNELHTLGFVHRDVKPENILIDRCGHIKLADFGSAATLNKDGTVIITTPVGTPDYIAPELLETLNSKKPFPTKHNTSCDYWGLGIIGYEFITETTPFQDESQLKVYANISNFCRNSDKLKYPNNIKISEKFKDLINRLITKSDDRLSFSEIKKHSFFEGVLWNDLRDQTPPIIPSISGEDDVSNFNQEATKIQKNTFSKVPSRFPTSNNEFSGNNLPFIGYTFVRHVPNKLISSFDYEDKKIKSKISKLEDTISEQSKEIKNLHSNLLEAQRKSVKSESLERILNETKAELFSMKDKLNKKTADLASSRMEVETLKSHLKIEREDIVKTESKIKDIFRSTHEKYEKEKYLSDKNYEKQIFEKNSEITQLHEELKLCEAKLNHQIEECVHLQNNLSNYKDILKNSKQQLNSEKLENEKNRKVLIDSYETKLQELKTKLKSEKDFKNKKCEELYDLQKELNDTICSSESEVEARRVSDSFIDELKTKLNEQIEINQQFREAKRQLEIDLANIQEQYDNLDSEFIKLKETKSLSNRSSKSDDSSQFTSANDSDSETEERLRNDLIIAKENENIQRKKAKDSEEIIRRLEQAIASLNHPVNNEILERQNEKLEDKLEALREQAIIDRQSARTANLSLWKMEKQLEDINLEKKALLRRLELGDEKILKMKEDKLEIESKLKQNIEIISVKDTNIEELKREIASLKLEVKRDKNSLLTTEKGNMKLQQLIDEQQAKIQRFEEKIEKDKNKLAYVHETNEKLTVSNKNLAKELSERENEISDCNDRLSATQRELISFQRNFEMLKNACTITETQLNEIESMLEVEVKRNKINVEKIEDLWSKIRKKDEELMNLNKQLNYETSSKTTTDKKLVNLEKELEVLKNINNEISKQCGEQQRSLDEKTMNICELQEKLETLSQELSDLQHIKANVEQELIVLKEEHSKKLTALYLNEEELNRLTRELKDAKNVIHECKQEIAHITNAMVELKTYNSHRQIKFDTTVAQQTKLIDHLQAQVEDSRQKKKKNFSEIFFGTNSKKENLPLSAIENSMTFKRLQQEYRQEKLRNEKLTEQLLRAKTDLRETNVLQRQASNVVEKTNIIDDIQTTESSDHQSIVTAEEPQKGHRFEMTIENVNQECFSCSKIIINGNSFWHCKECKIMIHRKCKGDISWLCGGRQEDRNTADFESLQIGESNDNINQEIENDLVELILTINKQEPTLYVNAMYEVSENIIVLGADTGLYSYHLDTNTIVYISGMEDVNYIAITPTLSKSLLIGSRGQQLFQCDLRHLISRAQSIACLKPKLDVKLLDYCIVRRLPNERYHYVKIYGNNDSLQDVRVIAATTERILIMHYDVSVSKFTPLRALDTATPITSALFTAHTVIISSDKFFEVDLKTFGYEELLDFSDKSIINTKNCTPLSAFCINKQEYLLCFKEFGIFVDEFGCRSRANDINWTSPPFKFIYREPLLFIQHTDMIQILQIRKSYSKMMHMDDYDQNVPDQEQNFKKQKFIDLKAPNLLADAGKYSVYVLAENDNTKTKEIVLINGEKLLKMDIECSLNSLLTTDSVTTYDDSN